VQCYQPGGGAIGSWDARPSTPLKSARIVDGLLNHNRGDGLNKVISPADLAHSMIFQRLIAKNAPRMPPLASNELDPSAHNLLRQCIDSLQQ
jgi:hypothetical protein